MKRIVRLEQLGQYRDGGSVSASFETEDGLRHVLFFRIKRHDDGSFRPRCYTSAVLREFTPSEYRSPVTGDVTSMWIEGERQIPWEEARAILAELAPFASEHVSKDSWIYGEMVDAADHDGR
jgi:hypothetical protein